MKGGFAIHPLLRIILILALMSGPWFVFTALTEDIYRMAGASEMPVWLGVSITGIILVFITLMIRSKTFFRRYDPGLPISPNIHIYYRHLAPPLPRLPDDADLEQSPIFDNIVKPKPQEKKHVRAKSHAKRRQKHPS